MNVYFILPVTMRKRCSLLHTIEGINFGLVRMYVCYIQIVGFPICTNCAPFLADLFLFFYERGFMSSLPADNQADIIEAFS